MKLLLTSAGVSNASIHSALVNTAIKVWDEAIEVASERNRRLVNIKPTARREAPSGNSVMHPREVATDKELVS